MKQLICSLVLIAVLVACKKDKQPLVVWQAYDETGDIEATQKLKESRMHMKLINSKVSNKNDIWSTLEAELTYFTEQEYRRLSVLILEKDIPTLQQLVKKGKLSYEELTKFFIYRIRKYESDNALSLNAVISLNPLVVEQARALDNLSKEHIDEYSVYGMPILLKDNINYREVPTTAGAIALQKNKTNNAFIVNKLLDKKALILGKANLSEWAYYMCLECPVGYSAVGGQTLNPYGRMIFEPGGSSSGSGVGVAANFCVAAVGTETSGSIVSPSSQNSVVGLKPTIGTLSRTGIVPISSALDTPGPMTKNVIDNVIVFTAMIGKDVLDEKSKIVGGNFIYATKNGKLSGIKFGVITEFLEDPLYQQAVDKIKNAGATMIEVTPTSVPLHGFTSLLNMDMKAAFPAYVQSQADQTLAVRTIEDVINFNKKDVRTRIPYGQQVLEGIMKDTTSSTELLKIKYNLQKIGRDYFDQLMDAHGLQAILSVNNYHAGYAAVAQYPAITVPMGYADTGEPKGLTFIAKSFSEVSLFKFAYAYEKVTNERKIPVKYIE